MIVIFELQLIESMQYFVGLLVLAFDLSRFELAVYLLVLGSRSRL